MPFARGAGKAGGRGLGTMQGSCACYFLTICPSSKAPAPKPRLSSDGTEAAVLEPQLKAGQLSPAGLPLN